MTPSLRSVTFSDRRVDARDFITLAAARKRRRGGRRSLLRCMSLLLLLDGLARLEQRAEFQCPLLGVKRTLIGHSVMSAYDPFRKSTMPFCCDAKRSAAAAATDMQTSARSVDEVGRASKTIVARGRAASSHFLIVTNVTAFTKLFARTNLPSRVTEVLRTILPPPGITQL